MALDISIPAVLKCTSTSVLNVSFETVTTGQETLIAATH
jgi:hypothetical protein